MKAMSDTTQILTRTFAAAPPTRVRDSSRVRDYVDLLKPRVMSLVVFTGLVGVLIAPGHAHPFAAALAVLAIALGSGAAGRTGENPRPALGGAGLEGWCGPRGTSQDERRAGNRRIVPDAPGGRIEAVGVLPEPLQPQG